MLPVCLCLWWWGRLCRQRCVAGTHVRVVLVGGKCLFGSTDRHPSGSDGQSELIAYTVCRYTELYVYLYVDIRRDQQTNACTGLRDATPELRCVAVTPGPG